jgi:hypothetical protein
MNHASTATAIFQGLKKKRAHAAGEFRQQQADTHRAKDRARQQVTPATTTNRTCYN